MSPFFARVQYLRKKGGIPSKCPPFLPEYNTYATIRYPLVLVIDERYQRLRDLWWRSHTLRRRSSRWVTTFTYRMTSHVTLYVPAILLVPMLKRGGEKGGKVGARRPKNRFVPPYKAHAWRQKSTISAWLLLPFPTNHRKSMEILAKLDDRSNAIAQSCGRIWPNQRASIINRIHTLRLW